MTILWILLVVVGIVCLASCWLYENVKPAADAYKKATKKAP
jgi:hypothetical protein